MDPFVAEIRLFGFNFAPKGWALCQGQLLPIQQYSAVFSLLGTYYGGNGTSNFALPNLQGYTAISSGQGPGLQMYDLGEAAGEPSVTLIQQTMAMHTHGFNANTTAGTIRTSPGNLLSVPEIGGRGAQKTGNLYAPTPAATAMGLQTLQVAGGSQPHNNMQPYLTLNYCIALQGVFPPRS